MMLHKIGSLFTDENVETSIEDFDFAYVSYTINQIKLPTQEELSNTVSSVIFSNKLSITVAISNGESDVYSQDNYQEFINNVRAKLHIKDEEENISLSIRIAKNNSNSGVFVYSLNELIKYLRSLSVEQILSLFASKLVTNVLIFKCCDLDEVYNTESIIFGPVNYLKNFEQQIDRRKRIDVISSSVYSLSKVKLTLIPEDFILNNLFVDKYIEIQEILQRCAFALIISSLFDIAGVENNTITYRLNGYKTIQGKYDCSIVHSSYNDYKLIYNWVYTSGNIVDKLGLARNIISLHLEDANRLVVKGSVYQSILSSFQVYQKQNIKQYIEIRNKISEQLLDFNKRATNIVDTFASGFQKSALAVISFFSTIVAIKFLSTASISMTFTFNSLIVACIFIILSLFYLLISRKETKEQLERFEKSYINLKERYTDLLTKDDIERILNDDKEHKDDIIFINKKMQWYSQIWLLVLVLVFLATIFFFSSGVYEVVRNMLFMFF